MLSHYSASVTNKTRRCELFVTTDSSSCLRSSCRHSQDPTHWCRLLFQFHTPGRIAYLHDCLYNFATVYDWRSTILLLIIYLHSRLYRRTRDPFLAILYIFNFYQHSEIFWQRNCVNSSLNYTMHLLHLRNNIRIPVKNNTPQHVYKILQQ